MARNSHNERNIVVDEHGEFGVMADKTAEHLSKVLSQYQSTVTEAKKSTKTALEAIDKDTIKNINETHKEIGTAISNYSSMTLKEFNDLQTKINTSLSADQRDALKAFMSQLDQQVQATDKYNKEKENVEKQHFAASKVMWKNGFGELSAIEQVHEIESIEAKQKAEKRKQEDLVKFFDAQLQIRNDNQAAIFAQYDADTQAQIKKINRDASLDREAKKEARKRIREENAQKKKLYQEDTQAIVDEQLKAQQNIKDIEGNQKETEQLKQTTISGKTAKEKLDDVQSKGRDLKHQEDVLRQGRDELTSNLKDAQEQESKVQAELAQAEASGDTELAAQKQKELGEITNVIKNINANLGKVNEELKENADEQQSNSEDEKEARKSAAKEQNRNALETLKSGATLKDALKQGLKNVVNAVMDMSKQIDQKISAFYQYQAKMEARLQGSQTSYASALKMISKNVGMSPLMKQETVVTKMQELIDSGVAYDLELRAFLATISDDIASTFNVMQASLARMIRVQQSDSTAMRLGMEAYLTRFYNGLFSDTSYLTDQFDTVTDAIFEASSKLEKAQSIEFEYAVQKWLGSLYSLGLSQQTVTQIATGLNALGTGDVEALNGNSQLTTLFGMATSRAQGVSLTDFLVNGMDADKANVLMESMVEYLRDIAKQTKDNNVVAKSYSNMLGISMSDLTVLSKIDNKTLNNISNSVMSYDDTLKELSYQTGEIVKRVHMSTMLNTMKENALMSAATGIGSSPALYAMWLAASVVKDVTGGIAIPAINVFGSGIDLETTVMDLILTGIGGFSLLTTLLGALFNGSLFGTYDLEKWGYDEVTSRGNAPKIGGSGVSSGFSESTSLSSTGSSSSEDIEDSTLSSNAESGAEKGKKMNKSAGVESEHTFDEFYKNIFDEKIPINIEGEILTAIKDAIGDTNTRLDTSNSLIDAIKSAVLGTINTAITNTPIDVSIAGGGFDFSASGDGGTFFAHGGIVTSATNAIIGENGAEAVIPLENHTEWLDGIEGGLGEIASSVKETNTLLARSSSNGALANQISSSYESSRALSIMEASTISSLIASQSSSSSTSSSAKQSSTSSSAKQSSSQYLSKISSSSKSSAMNSNYDDSSITTASGSFSSISTSEQVMNNIQSIETALTKFSSDGDTTLNVNVKNVPSVNLEGISSDAKRTVDDFTSKTLKSVIIAAIQSGLNVIDENNEPIDLMALLGDIRDNTLSSSRDVDDINNKMRTLMFRTNM